MNKQALSSLIVVINLMGPDVLRTKHPLNHVMEDAKMINQFAMKQLMNVSNAQRIRTATKMLRERFATQTYINVLNAP